MRKRVCRSMSIVVMFVIMSLFISASQAEAGKRICTCLTCVMESRNASSDYDGTNIEEEAISDAVINDPPVADIKEENHGDIVIQSGQDSIGDAAGQTLIAQHGDNSKRIIIIFESAARKKIGSQEIRSVTLYLNTCVPQDKPCTVLVYLPESSSHTIRINHALECKQVDCINQGFYHIMEKQTLVAQSGK